MRKMNAWDIVGILFVIIIIASAVGFALWMINRAGADAYSVKMRANAGFLQAMGNQGPHNVTVDRRAQMTIRPIEQAPSMVQNEAPQSQQSVRYVVTPDKPDSKERQDLLKIVNLSIQRLGNTASVIYSGNKCNKAGLMNEMRWQEVINWGKDMFGIVAIPRGETNTGQYFKNLSDLEEAINAYDVIPTAPTGQASKA